MEGDREGQREGRWKEEGRKQGREREEREEGLTTQVLCGQCEVNHYTICRTTVPVLSVFYQRFQSTKTTKTPVLLGNIEANVLLHISYFMAKI